MPQHFGRIIYVYRKQSTQCSPTNDVEWHTNTIYKNEKSRSVAEDIVVREGMVTAKGEVKFDQKIREGEKE